MNIIAYHHLYSKEYIQTLEDWKTLLQTGYKGGLFYRKDREKTGSA